MFVSREFAFAAAHRLPGYRGACEKLHGHTWRVRVTVQAPVGPRGIAFDFRDLRDIVKERVLSTLDHADLNEVLPEPSAERIAQWVWEQLSDLPLYEVRVWESAETFVSYRGPEREASGDA